MKISNDIAKILIITGGMTAAGGAMMLLIIPKEWLEDKSKKGEKLDVKG